MSRVLTMSEIDDLKDKNETSHDFRPLSRQECRNLIHTIEALQQEIEQHIKWNEAHTKARVEQAEQIAALTADKDELAGRMREALEQFKYDYEQGMNMSRNYNAVCELLRDAAPTDYHNPADVAEIESLKEQVDTLSDTVNMLAPVEISKECRHIEALRQAREALTMWNKNLSCDCDQCKATREALAEIDKTLGGKEDA